MVWHSILRAARWASIPPPEYENPDTMITYVE